MKKLMVVFLILILSSCNNNSFENRKQEESYGYNISENQHSNEQKIINQEKERVNKNPEEKINKKILDVPLILQNPELKYGCEVTSLTMVLQYAGINTDKMELANEMTKDKDELIKSESGDIVKWGNPNEGFVGDVTGKSPGYAIFDKPLEDLMRKYLGDRTINLTGKSFDHLTNQIGKNRPVIVWTTGDYRLPDRWESWEHNKEQIKTPLDLHAVVLVGFDEENVYINDPLAGKKQLKVNKEVFIKTWEAMKKRALSYN